MMHKGEKKNRFYVPDKDVCYQFLKFVLIELSTILIFNVALYSLPRVVLPSHFVNHYKLTLIKSWWCWFLTNRIRYRWSLNQFVSPKDFFSTITSFKSLNLSSIVSTIRITMKCNYEGIHYNFLRSSSSIRNKKKKKREKVKSPKAEEERWEKTKLSSTWVAWKIWANNIYYLVEWLWVLNEN